MVETIQGWRCIGCGKVEAPAPCIGVCEDRRVELVRAQDCGELAWRVREREAAVGVVARVTPTAGGLEASWRAFQERARRLLDAGTPGS